MTAMRFVDLFSYVVQVARVEFRLPRYDTAPFTRKDGQLFLQHELACFRREKLARFLRCRYPNIESPNESMLNGNG